MLKRRGGNSAHVFSWFTYIVSLEVINRLSVRGRKSRLYAEVMLQKKKKEQHTQRLNNEKRRPLNSCETARRRSRAGAGRGRLLWNCREGGREIYRESARAPVSALFLPSCFSLSLAVSERNKFRRAAVNTAHRAAAKQRRGLVNKSPKDTLRVAQQSKYPYLNDCNVPLETTRGALWRVY